MITAVLALVYVVIVTVTANWCRKLDTYVSPLTMMGLSGLIYLVSIPLEVAVLGVPFGSMRTDSDASTVVGLAILAYAFFAAGYITVLNKRRTVSEVFARIEEEGGHLSALPLVTSVAFAGIVLVLFPGAVTSVGTYDGNITLMASNSAYALLVKFAMQAYAIWAFAAPLRGRSATLLHSLVRALPLILWGIYSSDKDPLVLAGFTFFSLFFLRFREVRSTAAFVTTLVGASVAVGVATFAFSIVRGGGSGILDRLRTSDGLFRNIEPAGPMRSILSALDQPPGTRYLWGESLLQGLIMWIPQSIWAGRPPDLSQQFAMENVSNWEPGRAYGFSLVADGLLNGSLVGVALLFAITGALVGAIRNVLLRPSPYREFDAFKVGMLYTVGLFICFVALRGPFSSVITQTVHASALAVVLWVGVGLLRQKKPAIVRVRS